MQIHELNTFTGTVDDNTYLAIDNGTDTSKISASDIVAPLEARMDSFTNLAEGSTTGDAELIDGRIGADGVTYTNIGGAIRGQIRELSARITDNDTDISALQTRATNLSTHKVAQPLDGNNQPTNGTSGQSLRTKGDGTTEWADVGLPTDEQTAEAVFAWLDDHPEATTTVQDDSITEAKFTNNLKLHTIKDYITPEMFGAVGDGVTDDSVAFQLAVDQLQQTPSDRPSTGGTIILKGHYYLGSDILFKRHSDSNVPFTFLGISTSRITFASGCSFAGTANDYGNVKFQNITFSDTDVLFRCDRKLIRVLCDNCTFDNVATICEATNVCQSMYFINCIMRGFTYVVDAESDTYGIYDIKITNCLIEKGESVYNAPTGTSYEIVITNNCIEGLTGFVAKFGVTRTVIVSENYFERNAQNVIFTNANTNNAIVSENNLTEPDAVALVELPTNVPFPATLKILNNNITDIHSSAEIHTALDSTREYTGLTIKGNNKVRSDSGLRQELGTLQAQRQEAFTCTVDGTEYPTIQDAAPEIGKYAHANGYRLSPFICNWTGKAVTNGIVFIDIPSNRCYVLVLNPSYVGYGAYALTTWGGSYRQVSLT